jgi:U1 small nuclear ribonucleoprotein
MREKDADYAIAKADARKIDGHRILVDRELGRTKKTWIPRRLGGGKGGVSRRAESDILVEEIQNELRREKYAHEDRLREE